ncbi:hypothetical protein J2S00_000965 [Caldalkalibacillus uzonensis]|uniref:Cytosolic protein n=1 Tax=Caldalkalibacillus uzonensis TaxID=353224 RepID=A0ABU0CP35_9BACI|nr:DUF6154 family protein [Caldalkalibacillus uzonensis]MDQ0338181.1 hypothetical protein [Caldalkalibacillus uzonensis]
MKFIDDLYEFYKEKLTGDEEDAVALVLYTLQEHSREDLMRLITEMSDEEVYQMVGQFLIDQLKEKMAREGVGQHRSPEDKERLH